MKEKRNLLAGVGLIGAFALWTVLIQWVDVQAVGQKGTRIGFADFNVWFHQLTGVHMTIYTITDWLGLVPILKSRFLKQTEPPPVLPASLIWLFLIPVVFH